MGIVQKEITHFSGLSRTSQGATIIPIASEQQHRQQQ
jgi:hypothetical protein